MTAMGSAGAATARRRHIHAVDLARVLTVAFVIAVHVITHTAYGDTVPGDALVIVFHSSREIFFVLTALVLVHGYGHGSVRWLRFWRRRYLYVGVPYVAWTLVYIAADFKLFPLDSLPGTLAGDLLTGGARYQMYFLLVSMQIYLSLPVLRWLLRVTERHHGLLLAGCAVYQVVFSQAVHMDWSPGFVVLSAWIHGPDAVLPSYLLYVVAGGVAAWHLDDVTAWTLRHRRAVFAGAALAIAAGLGAYLAQAQLTGIAPKLASGVFQPVVVVESLAIATAFLAAGLTWVERGMRWRGMVLGASDASFGVYLAHPLLLQGLTAAATMSGLWAASAHVPIGLTVLVMLAVVVPVLYAGTALPTALFRRTPLSLSLTGRPQLRPSTALSAHPATSAIRPTGAVTTLQEVAR